MKIETLSEEIEEKKIKALERIRQIKFFQPVRSLTEANSQIPKVNEIIKNYMHGLGCYKRVGKTWYETWESVLILFRTEISEVGQSEILDAILDEVQYKTFPKILKAVSRASRHQISDEFLHVKRGIARDASWYVAWYVAWEALGDLVGFKKNLISYIIMLYEIGLKPNNFRKVDGKEKFVFDVPLNYEGEFCLGCCAYRDKKIDWLHEWKDNHKNLKPVKVRRIE